MYSRNPIQRAMGVIVATKKDPGVRSNGFNNNEKGLETTNGKHIEESEINMEMSTFDIKDEISSRTIRRKRRNVR